MNNNPIDEFRKAFFDKVIAQEKETAAAIKRKQVNCWHKYKLNADTAVNHYGYITLSCSKCGHTSTRSFSS